MIIGIEGGVGSGKTIMMVRYLLKDSLKGNMVYANFGLKNIRYKPLDVLEILRLETNQKSLSNVSIGIDEITVFADCRMSSSIVNRLFSYFILQTRKRNVILYYTTQDILMIDIRLRRHTDIIVEADFVFDEDDMIHPIKDIRRYEIWDFRDPRNSYMARNFIMNIKPYYKYYDTNQVILPPIIDKKKLKELTSGVKKK